MSEALKLNSWRSMVEGKSMTKKRLRHSFNVVLNAAERLGM